MPYIKNHIFIHLNNDCSYNVGIFLVSQFSCWLKKKIMYQKTQNIFPRRPPKTVPQRYFLLDSSIFLLSITDALK